MPNAYGGAKEKLRADMSKGQQRNALARDRGYSCYDLAHDVVRQEIDELLGDSY